MEEEKDLKGKSGWNMIVEEVEIWFQREKRIINGRKYIKERV